MALPYKAWNSYYTFKPTHTVQTTKTSEPNLISPLIQYRLHIGM
jgi:hypothetical protein